MVLALHVPQGQDVLRGVLFKPNQVHILGQVATSVALPIVEDAVTGAEIDGACLGLQIKGENDAPLDFEMVLKTPHSATLSFKSAALSPLKLTRVRRDAVVAASWDMDRRYVLGEAVEDNAELAELLNADQADRKNPSAIGLHQLAARDTERRRTVDGILRRDELRTGADFLHAAIIFQHGDRPADFLLAHALALVAMHLGNGGAGWVAGATLDRYLLACEKLQIFGTQSGSDHGLAMLDRDLIPDTLRLRLGIPTVTDRDLP